ncbi:murein biosynthesis integral membrane protein MurJ [Catenulispora rubra]|uniref:murein biosynthesis integral membrane protein MurJ n=1 Tax=Catenulispora rubra TaxID=280293 RepID=UPI001892647C|nr:lipid II flippase MurJ [Catenulispora rubra]
MADVQIEHDPAEVVEPNAAAQPSVPEQHAAASLASPQSHPSPPGSPSPPSPRGPRLPHRANTLLGAAVLIAIATVASRVVGFGRWLVFSHTVGAGSLADAYNSANQLPNIVFEITAGGALAGVAVPLLAGPLTGGDGPADRARASRIVSALLTWTLAILIPLSATGVALAGPMGHILGSGHGPFYTDQISRFLIFFLPQIPLYGAAVVLGATLQADRRFLAPALAPLLSSLVVIASYTVFAFLDRGRGAHLRDLRHLPELVLALGTSAGVLILVLSLLPAVRRAKLNLRPTFRFPEGVARKARSLGVAGVATLIAQQLAVLTIVLLSNAGHASTGTLTVFNLVWAVYSLPYAVLAVPVATSAFTDLSAKWAAGDRRGYAHGVAATTQAVVIFSAAGASVLAAAAWPTARLFLTARHGTGGSVTVEMMGQGLTAFAPGLIGYGLLAHLSRALYASGRGRAAATAVCAGWFTVLVADLTLVELLPGEDAVIALGLGNIAGMTVAGAALLGAVRRGVGRDALAGVGRAGLVAALAAAVAAPIGMLFAALPGATGPLRAMLIGAATALLTVALFVGVAVVASKRLLPDTECGKWLRAPIEYRYRNRRGRRSAP